MKRILLAFGILVALTGCDKPEVFTDTVATYRVLSVNPPKHVYVDLQNVKTGQIYRHQYVNKHCNRWREIKIGGLWNIHEVVYRYTESNRFTTKLVGLSTICPRY